MSKRWNHAAAFKVRVVLEAPIGERMVSELATACVDLHRFHSGQVLMSGSPLFEERG